MTYSLLITPAFPPQRGGIQTVLFELVSHQISDEVVVMTQDFPNVGQFDETCPFEILRQSPGWWKPIFQAVNTLLSPLLGECLVYLGPAYKLLRGGRVDLIQCGHIRVGFVACLLKRCLGVPFVVYAYAQEVVRAAIPPWRPLDSVLRKFVLRQAGVVFTSSEYTRQRIVDWRGGSTKVVKIPFGVNLERFAVPTEPIDQLGPLNLREKHVILTVGRLVERKGHDIVIKALPKVLECFPDVLYIIVGDGPMMAPLRALVDEHGLGKHVVFAGKVPDDAIVHYYQACDVFIMASRAREREGDVEGFGLVYLEANACGKPVIGGRSGGVPDAVLDGVTGLLVEPTDTDDIAAAIIKLLADRDYARRLGENGRRRVEIEMNWDNAAACVRTALLDLVRRRE